MIQSRKQFINTVSWAFVGFFVPENLQSATDQNEPVIVHADEGETYWIGRRNSPLTIKISRQKNKNKAVSFCTEDIAPGEGIPVHKHLNEDELIFIHAGEGILTVDDKEIPVRKGTVALVPKNCWHSINNTGSQIFIMAFSYTPAGFEGYFREFGSPAGTPWQPKSQEQYEKINKKWGIVYR